MEVKNKNGAPASAFAPHGNVTRTDPVYRVSCVCPFAQSLREPFSPRSSERYLSKLAYVLLRVNAKEVKKKFWKIVIEIADQREKIFSDEFFFAIGARYIPETGRRK